MEGAVSSRQIATRTYTDLAYRVLTVDQHPDFRTISDFRERRLAALQALFPQVVRLAQRLGLVKLEQVAQDGTKVLANASKHRAMSYARMQEAEARLGKEVAALLEAARAADAAEDAEYDALPISPARPRPPRAEAEAVRAADAAERG